jgi:predicted kinase
MQKKIIKNMLRESITKNILGVEVSRPNQELIVMRGIPGAGKSTEAKKRLAEGAIHSTDDLIEATGDYAGHFAKMVKSGDWSAHSIMHNNNYINAKNSMADGISPVIIDNTNIKANEAKKYVEAALIMGLSENNIYFVDVGDGGCTAEVLAERNTHNVPLETIERMMKSHKSVGTLTVKKVLEAKDMYKPKKIAMVVLDKTSTGKLLTAVRHNAPENWKTFAHHMTINLGKGLTGELVDDVGKTVTLRAVAVGKSDMAMAVKVEGYHSDNAIPHVTVAVNVADGGKPVMSNQITNWKNLDSYINLNGVVTENKLG